MSGGKADRVPVIPKMWVDTAAHLTGTPLLDVVRDPETALRVMIDAALLCKSDAIRIWHFPRRDAREIDGRVVEFDRDGRAIGEVDMIGGLQTHLYSPEYYDVSDPYTMVHHRFWTCLEKPLVDTVEDAARIYVPTPADYERFGCGDRARAQFARAGDKVLVIGDCDCPTLSFYISFRGMSNALMDLIDNPELTHAVMDKATAIAIERAKFNIDMGRRVLRIHDSAATMTLLSPATWREYIKPRFTRFCTEVHAYCPDTRLFCHICGNILPVLDDLVETGMDCISPLDPLGGMTTKAAREVVGGRAALMGGVNTLSFINHTPEQIIEESRACIEGAAADGGYILGSGCDVPRYAKLENLLALAEAARKYGTYRTKTNQ
jgi:uroporphyrinogen-III decarboxylase